MSGDTFVGSVDPQIPDQAAGQDSAVADAAAFDAAGAAMTQPTDPDAAASGSATEQTATAEQQDSAARVLQLEQQLAALRDQHDNLNGQYMRLAADFDNYRKRQSRDLEDQRLQITCSTLSEILPVVDNFDRARQQLNPQHEEAQTLHRSYQGLYKQLVEVFKQLGVSPMRVEGEPFDPTLHEAVMREPSEQHGEDMVIEELQRGYQLNGRVLRHALVKVSMGPGPGGGNPGAEPAEPPAQEQGG